MCVKNGLNTSVEAMTAKKADVDRNQRFDPSKREKASNSRLGMAGQMKPAKSKKDPVYVMDILERLGRKFEAKPDLLRVQDLLGEGPSFAIETLSQVLRTKVEQYIPTGAAGANILWEDPGQYAPTELDFFVNEESVLPIDENGHLQNPLAIREYKHTKTYLEFDPISVFRSCSSFDINTYRSLYGVTGRLTVNDHGMSHFYPSQSAEADDVLLVANWGGDHQKSYGLLEGEAREMVEAGKIKYFEKVTSKHGGEGRDYFIFSLAEHSFLAKAVATDEEEISQTEMAQLVHLSQKLQVIEKAQVGLQKVAGRYDEIRLALNAIQKYHRADPISSEPFVFVPKLEVPMPEILQDSMAFSTELSLEDLTAAVPDFDDLIDKLNYAFEYKKIEDSTWQKFAPQFNNWQPLAKELHGWIEILGTRAVLHASCLKISDRDSTEPKKTFTFDEASLLQCATLLQRYLAEESAHQKEEDRLRQIAYGKMTE